MGQKRQMYTKFESDNLTNPGVVLKIILKWTLW